MAFLSLPFWQGEHFTQPSLPLLSDADTPISIHFHSWKVVLPISPSLFHAGMLHYLRHLLCSLRRLRGPCNINPVLAPGDAQRRPIIAIPAAPQDQAGSFKGKHFAALSAWIHSKSRLTKPKCRKIQEKIPRENTSSLSPPSEYQQCAGILISGSFNILFCW